MEELIQLLNNLYGLDLNINDYSGYLIKKITTSSCISIRKQNNGYHIEVTDPNGPMRFFPIVASSAYIATNDARYKRSYYSRIKLQLISANLRNLISSLSDRANTGHCVLRNNRGYYNNTIEHINALPEIFDSFTHGTYEIRLSNRQHQFEIGTSSDHELFLALRYAVLPGDYIIFLKKRNTFIYLCFGLAAHEYDNQLNNINDVFYLSDDDGTVINTEEIIGNIPGIIKGNPNIIFYGPPGTGKTYKIRRDFLFDKNENESEFITFHQAYSYEEFVEGIKPVLTPTNQDGAQDVKYEYSKGIFYNACNKAARMAGYTTLDDCLADTKETRKEKFQNAIDENNIFIFCIDEINRANIPGVFGELITLIETNKRLGADEEIIARLPYSKQLFGVPSNMMIIGTMNSADRSITLVDTALRRRFDFNEIPPDSELLSGINIVGINLPVLLNTINKRIKYFLGKDNCIGHAYFMNQLNPNKRDLLRIFTKRIIPLLEEYFYNDFKKISMVLGDFNKEEIDIPFFIKDTESDPALLFSNQNDDIDEKEIYMLNPEIIQYLEQIETEIPDTIFTKIYN